MDIKMRFLEDTPDTPERRASRREHEETVTEFVARLRAVLDVIEEHPHDFVSAAFLVSDDEMFSSIDMYGETTRELAYAYATTEGEA